LTVLKIELDRLPVIVLGNSDGALQVGDPGCWPLAAVWRCSGVSNIVSASRPQSARLNAAFENFIQTDRAPAQTAGGALVIFFSSGLWALIPPFIPSGGSMVVSPLRVHRRCH
jgi:S1-C subfamily serine protease